MTSVPPGTAISVVSIAASPLTIQARLESLEGRYAEVTFAGETAFSPGSLVELKSPATLYLGEIESSRTQDGTNYIRVRIEHSVELEKAAAIRALWNTSVSP